MATDEIVIDAHVQIYGPREDKYWVQISGEGPWPFDTLDDAFLGVAVLLKVIK